MNMNLKRAHRYRHSHLIRLDAVMDSYLQWREESRAVSESYRIWHRAQGGERDMAFEDYVAALDREEIAACGYRRVVERADV